MGEAVRHTLMKPVAGKTLRMLRGTFNFEVGKGVQDVKAKLGLWIAVLKDLDAGKSKHLSVYNIERDIRDLVCRLQDVLETYSNKVQSRRGRTIKCNPAKFIEFLGDFQFFQLVDLEVDEITTRIMSKIQVLESLNIYVLANIEEERSHSTNENPERQIRNTLSQDEHFVGMNDTYVAGDDPNGLIHGMEHLSISDSSELFWKTAFLGNPNEVDSLRKQIGEELLEVCKGLPSDIIALGKVLATKHTVREWEIVLQNSKSSMSRGLPVDQIRLGQLTSAFPNFNDLPFHLKECFLYLGLFPMGSKVKVEDLYFLWIAEGMISLEDCQNNETMMDLAERYLSVLVQRKMIEVEEEETPSFRIYKSCWVHDRMQDHYLLTGEEYFFKVIDFRLRTQRRADSYSSSSISTPARRLALHLSKHDKSLADQLRNETVNHLRSLLLLNPHDLQMKLEWPQRMFDPKKFRMLKVLIFERVNFRESGLPRGITRLIYLRHLSFKGCILEILPSSIGNLSFLKSLDLRVSSPIIIPNVLRKMEKLGYLYLPFMFETPDNEKLYLGSLKELEILENFDTRVCNVADLFEMTNLQHLSMTVEGNSEDLLQIVHRMDMTSDHASVLYPSIKVKNFDCYTEERHFVFRKLLSCDILHTLYMDGYLAQLPPHYKISSSVKEIVLIGSELKEDPMTTLDKLPKLQVLVLQDDAFVGKKMICVESGFGKLKRLELLTLLSLETWEVEEKSMPMLSILAVKNCRKLQIPPDELRKRVPSVTFENGN